jgi:hypothetical protein
MTMFANIDNFNEDEPPQSRAEALAGKASRLLLLVLCVGPIALFPLALAYRAYTYFFP